MTSTTATATTATTTTHELLDLEKQNDDLHQAARLLAGAFLGSIWPKGLTDVAIDFRVKQLSRLVTLHTRHGKKSHVRVAKQGDRVVGVIAWVVSTLEDDASTWSQLVPSPELPTNGDVVPEKWHAMRSAFAQVDEHVFKQVDKAEILYLVVDPTIQRSGAGTILLKTALEQIGPNKRTVLVSAPTESANPFYVKFGFTELKTDLMKHVEFCPDQPSHFGAWEYRS
ncbi:unnamed protein product [Sympodiomycopsis kandeliae]